MKRYLSGIIPLLFLCIALPTLAADPPKKLKLRHEAPAETSAPAPSATVVPSPAAPAAKTGVWKEPITGIEFMPVKGGCFEMGDIFGEGGDDEKPVHEVCVSDFGMGKTEVTVGQFKTFVTETGYRTDAEQGDGCTIWTGSKWDKVKDGSWKKPGFEQTDAHPLVCVSWNDAANFAEWLSEKSGKEVHLPTEAEWEYAARSGGKRHKYAWGIGGPNGNVADESAKKKFTEWKEDRIFKSYDDGFVFTAPVGSFKANGLGLYDMTGNVWEWCRDWYGEAYYKESPVENPRGPSSGKYRVLRGGSWDDSPMNARVALRVNNEPSKRYSYSGFRLVVVSPK